MSDTPARPGIDLKRHLLLRVTFFALLICALASAFVLHQAQSRIRERIGHAGSAIERLISSEATQPRDVFRRSIEGLRLSMLEELGQLLNICVAVDDVYNRRVAQRCFTETAEPSPLMRWIMGRIVGPEVSYHGTIGQYPGIKVGEFVVTPNLDSEAAEVWRQLRLVLAITAGVLLVNLLVYLPVRRALRPTDRILATIGRLEAGDLAARMPRPALIELRRIAEGFDHLAERLQRTDRRQRQLAQRLLSVREEERRRLARELHDEFGQSLASIRAEAACAAEDARAPLPALLPSLEAIGRIAAGMMDNLQRILHQLRPVGLEAFGLRASLEQLVEAAGRGRPAGTVSLETSGEIDALPDDLTVSLYRIVQESLTNAMRHGEPQAVAVRLACDPTGVVLTVADDGGGGARDTAGSGLGVLGMTERVEALGGRFSLTSREPRGMIVRAAFPAAAMTMEEDDDDDPAAAGR